MKVLVACECSGIVRDAFIEKGHDAWSCDVKKSEVGGNHIQDDVFNIINNKWDLMIAHPPCTYLSNAGARWLYPEAGQLDDERYKKGLLAKEFFLKLLNSNIPKIAVENPKPSNIYLLPKYSQIIQPYEFGEKYSKKTYLWLKNLPTLDNLPLWGAKINYNYEPLLPSNTGGKKRGQKATIRKVDPVMWAKTFPKVAKAMANQWG